MSHFPLERDPGQRERAGASSGAAAAARARTPARLPQARREGHGAATAMLGAAVSPALPARALPASPRPQQAARRKALITLVDRVVAAVVDLASRGLPLLGRGRARRAESSRAAREQARAMRDEGEAPDGVDLELLARDALRELVGLGPSGRCSRTTEIAEVHVPRPDCVLAVRDGQARVGRARRSRAKRRWRASWRAWPTSPASRRDRASSSSTAAWRAAHR